MIAARRPVAVCSVFNFSPQCGQLAAFGEISFSQALHFISFIVSFSAHIRELKKRERERHKKCNRQGTTKNGRENDETE